MGQGYSAIHPSAGTAGIDAPELADLDFDRSLAGARFLKTVRARSKHGLVVVKIYTKPYASLSLNDRINSLLSERHKLAAIPNALPYHRIIETPTAAYVARQHVHSSLYDRISTNPPLEDIERRWIAFQLLCALKDCHARNITHGDLKTDNLLLTSWNWLYLTDFSSCIKPHSLPEDNPVDFTLFFDSTARRVCYIAPERFVKSTVAAGYLQWTADIFSAGCVIAELFTEKPTFTLSQLFRYKTSDHDPVQALNQDVQDQNIRDLITHMIQLNPDDRYSAEEYLNFWRGKVFPPYFYDFLHQYTHLITDPFSGQKPVVAGETNNGESDDRIDRVYYDYDKIAVALSFTPNQGIHAVASSRGHQPLRLALESLIIDLPGNQSLVKQRSAPSADNGALLFSTIVTASIRSTARARSKLRACELLLAFGEQLTDEARLDRLLPFAMTLLDDDSVAVQMTALRTITQLLSLVTTLSPINAFIFPRYVFPRLQRLVASSSFTRHAPVRAVYAGCLADLATTAVRFLDLTQAFRADGSLPSADPEAEDDLAAHAAYHNSHDVARDELVHQFEAQTKVFLTDDDPAVRRAFLSSVPALCVFFGDSLAADLILTHLNTYLNSQDWLLKCALFKTIVGVAAFIGGNSLENFILPLMIQALPDAEETVTEQTIRSLSAMAHLGLFDRSTTLSLLSILTRFSLHPNPWIREATAQFMASSVTYLPRSDVRSLVEPLVAPVLKIKIADMAEYDLLDTLKSPLPRVVLDMAKVWAGRHDKSHFWKAAKTSKVLSFEPTSVRPLTRPDDATQSQSLAKMTKTDEDEQWLSRLRHAGLRSDDEQTLVLLREYIYQNTIRAAKVPNDDTVNAFDRVVSLTNIKVPLQNILFDDEVSFYDQVAANMSPAKAAPSMSLIEALNDATKASSRPGLNPDHLEARINSLVKPDKPGVTPTIPPPVVAQSARRPSSIAISESSTRDAFSLMRPGSVARKAVAETGTDSVTVTARLDLPVSRLSTPRLGMSEQPSPTPAQQLQMAGGVPLPINVRGLETLPLTHYPVDIAEFGPLVSPVKRITPDGISSPGHWKPQGHVIAAIGEHSAQITCITVSPDHIFFLTGSKDGTVRVWDTSRLEQNVTHRPRQIHRHTDGAAITSICFVERTHTFVSAATDGSINVVKVDVNDVSGTLRYGKLRILREWTLPSPKSRPETVHAVKLEHYREDNASICLMLTSSCSVIAVDLRSMEIMYQLPSPLDHGTPTSFCVHRRRQWLVVATTHGILDLWDLRFRILLRSWTFPNPAPITQVTLHPGRRSVHRARICIAGGTNAGHMSIWDLEKQVCTELFQVATSTAKKVQARDLTLVALDHSASQAQLAGAVAALSAHTQRDPPSDTSVRAFTIQMHAADDDDTESRLAYLVSAGPDLKLRFWDAGARPGASAAVNGSGVLLGGETAGPGYDNARGSSAMGSLSGSRPAAAGLGGCVDVELIGAETKVFTESSAVAAVASGSAAAGTAGPLASSNKSSRYDVIRASARGLMSCHADQVTCLACLVRPFEMVVSCDRSGMMYISR